MLTLTFALAFETHTLAFSDNRIANEIAANGANSFFRAVRTNEIDYHTYYDAASDSYHPAPLNPRLNDLAVAYYQTAFELFRTRRYN